MDTPDQMNDITRRKVLGEKEISVYGGATQVQENYDTNNSVDVQEAESGSERSQTQGEQKEHGSKTGSKLGHTYQTVFNLKVAGFTSHTFNSDFTELTTNFVSYDGENIHSFTVYKDGSFV